MDNILVNKEFEKGTMQPLKNNKGVKVDKYIPRKCGATSRLIGPRDHAAIQLFVPGIKEDGTVDRENGYDVAICGFIRDKGRSDYEIEKLLRYHGYYPNVGSETTQE